MSYDLVNPVIKVSFGKLFKNFAWKYVQLKYKNNFN